MGGELETSRGAPGGGGPGEEVPALPGRGGGHSQGAAAARTPSTSGRQCQRSPWALLLVGVAGGSPKSVALGVGLLGKATPSWVTGPRGLPGGEGDSGRRKAGGALWDGAVWPSEAARAWRVQRPELGQPREGLGGMAQALVGAGSRAGRGCGPGALDGWNMAHPGAVERVAEAQMCVGRIRSIPRRAGERLGRRAARPGPPAQCRAGELKKARRPAAGLTQPAFRGGGAKARVGVAAGRERSQGWSPRSGKGPLWAQPRHPGSGRGL